MLRLTCAESKDTFHSTLSRPSTGLYESGSAFGQTSLQRLLANSELRESPLISNPTGRCGSSCGLRGGPTGRGPTSRERYQQQTIPTSRVTLSRLTPHSAERRVTFPLRQYLGSALAAASQVRDTMPRYHASNRRAPLGIPSVLARIPSRLWQVRRPWARLR